jgi:hypothetical protein
MTCPCPDTFSIESDDERGHHVAVYCLRCGAWVRDERHDSERPELAPLYEAETLGAMEEDT